MHKFHDGLSVASHSQKDVEVFCHTRKYLLGSSGGVAPHLYRDDIAYPICNRQSIFVPRSYKHMHDSSRTKNQNHTVFSQSNHHVVYREFSFGWDYGTLPAIHKSRKSIFAHCYHRILSGYGNLEVCFLYAEMEPESLYGGIISGK